MSEPTYDFQAGDDILADEVNQNIEEALNDYRDFTLGENITAPAPVYLKASDGKIYKTISTADDEKIHSFVGFLVESGSTNNVKKVQVSGKVTGLSSLTAGSKVYLKDSAGTYGTTVGTYEKIIGLAVSTTALILRVMNEGALTQLAQTITGIKTFASIPVLPASDPTNDNQASRKKYIDTYAKYTTTETASDNLKHSNDASVVAPQGVGSYTKYKEILINEAITACRVKYTHNSGGNTNGKIRLYKNGVALGTEYDIGSATRTDDIGALSVGDLLQIYSYNNGGIDNTISNFRIYFDRKISKIGQLTITTAIPVNDGFITAPTNNS